MRTQLLFFNVPTYILRIYKNLIFFCFFFNILKNIKTCKKKKLLNIDVVWHRFSCSLFCYKFCCSLGCSAMCLYHWVHCSECSLTSLFSWDFENENCSKNVRWVLVFSCSIYFIQSIFPATCNGSMTWSFNSVE